MNETLFSFNLGHYEVGMYKHYHKPFYNGFIRQFAWFYVYDRL